VVVAVLTTIGPSADNLNIRARLELGRILELQLQGDLFVLIPLETRNLLELVKEMTRRLLGSCVAPSTIPSVAPSGSETDADLAVAVRISQRQLDGHPHGLALLLERGDLDPLVARSGLGHGGQKQEGGCNGNGSKNRGNAHAALEEQIRCPIP
jgi:hypothetical protein